MHKNGVSIGQNHISIVAKAGEISDLSELHQRKLYADSQFYISNKDTLRKERRKYMKEIFNQTISYDD